MKIHKWDTWNSGPQVKCGEEALIKGYNVKLHWNKVNCKKCLTKRKNKNYPIIATIRIPDVR